ncbi:MAG: hypothetical protein EBR27_12485 [Betaproteobacteria bacterium]|nr:hypothetical protein [Betaproteobacteria bacterium]
MGTDWILKNPPKVWKLKTNKNEIGLEGLKKFFKEHNYRFETFGSFAHRWIRDLIDHRDKIVLHHCQVGAAEKRIQSILGYSFYKFDLKNWRSEGQRILELLNAQK